MKIIMAGGGRKIFFLAKSFLSKGYNVTIINDDLEKCRKLSRQCDATVIHGDATEDFVLKDAKIQLADMVIALTHKDANNLVICQMAKKMYEVNRCIAVVNDPQNIEVFKQFGVDSVISSAQIISNLIEQRANVTEHADLTEMNHIFPISNGLAIAFEVIVESDYPICGNTLQEFDLPKDVLISCILRKETAIIPSPECLILENDTLVVITLPKTQTIALETITGRAE